MSAPVITFYTGGALTGNAPENTAVFNMLQLGQLATVFNFGTIDTGSSGSNTWIWIWNNIAGASSIADAILSSSTQYELGLGHHESGSTSHASESSYGWSLQSGSLTGSVWTRSAWYLVSGGAVFSSGANASGWVVIYSGSSGKRLELPGTGTVLSGSASLGGGSGSAWLIGTYIYVLNTTPQGSRTGSFCVKYKYT